MAKIIFYSANQDKKQEMHYAPGVLGGSQVNLNAYDPNQPRDPKGSSTGGQWTKAGGGGRSGGGSTSYELVRADKFKEISGIAKQYDDDYNIVGIRVQKEVFGEKEGEIFQHESLNWVDGDMTDVGTGGVSAIDIRTNFDNFSARQQMNYEGNVILILGGRDYYDGNDYGEVVISSPRVLKIIRLK